jgi:hypothetical protein
VLRLLLSTGTQQYFEGIQGDLVEMTLQISQTATERTGSIEERIDAESASFAPEVLFAVMGKCKPTNSVERFRMVATDFVDGIVGKGKVFGQQTLN